MQPKTISSVTGAILTLVGLSVIVAVQLAQIFLSGNFQLSIEAKRFDATIIYPNLIIIGLGVLLLSKSMEKD